MSKGSDINMPAPADPMATAQAQSGMNVDAAIASSLLNQINEVTPYGKVTYSMGTPNGGNSMLPTPAMPYTRPSFGSGDFNEPGTTFRPELSSGMSMMPNYNPSGGNLNGGGFSVGGRNIPQVTRTVELTPEAQAQLDAQMKTSRDLAQLAQSNIGRVQDAQNAGFSLEGLPQAVSGINAPMIHDFNGPQMGVQASLRQFDPMEGFDTSYLQEARVQPVQGLMGIGMEGLPDIMQNYADQGALLEKASFDRARSLLEPQFGQQMGQAEVRLSERGLPLSSQLGQDAIGAVTTAQNRALKEAALDAVFAGRQEQSRLAGLDMARRGQLFGERGQSIDTANRAGQQLFGQQTALRGQQFGEAISQADFANQARGQAFGQDLAAGQFRNAAQQQQFSQGLQTQAARNAAQQQAFNQAASNAALQNAARQQAIQERSFMRNIPLNDVATLMGTAGGVQLPQFQQMPNVAVNAPDYIGASTAADQIRSQNAQAQMQANASKLGGLFELGGALGGAAIGGGGWGSLFRW